MNSAVLRPALTATRTRIARADLVWLLVGGMAAIGLGLAATLLSVGPHPGAAFAIPWWILAGLFYLTEVRVVHLQFQREAHSFSLIELPLILGLFFASPAEVVLAAVVGAGLGLLVHRRPAPIKLLFNIALFLISAAVAATIFHALARVSSPLDPITWLAAFAATIGSTAVGLASVNAAIWLAQGRTDRRRLGLAVRFGAAVAVTNTCLALIGITLLSSAPSAVWLVAVPIALVAIAWRAYRAHISEREQHDSLELLYGTTRILHGGSDLEPATVALLSQARRTFRAQFAELILFTGDGHERGLRTIVGPEDQLESMASIRLDARRDALRLRAVAEAGAFLVPADPEGATTGDLIGGQPIRDAIVAPLLGERSLIGTIVMANRQGALGTFRSEELRLFETLATHAGIALENGRLGRSLQDLSELKEQLSHQALHDSLTGLGNRDLYLERLQAALGRRGRDGAVPVVLFIDLDDFKSVNDTLGHGAGDELLRSVAAGIEASIRPSDLAVRLAGDEFAVLVEDGRDIGGVIRIAERILEQVARPLQVEDRWVRTSASIGIAASRARSQSAEDLLRDADVAMYTAKSRGKSRFAVFDPGMEAELSDRQQLRTELAAAVAHRELALRYQPVTDLRTGMVVGFEALLRWNHPTRGELAPADFLALAEGSGLIVGIGRWVLREACRQAQAWRVDGSGLGLTMSVNVSLHQLLLPDFAEDVAGVLRTAGLPPEYLMLEFSEAQVMTEDLAIATRLRELKAVGVKLAIDGFGSGFSSVRYLGRYPVDVIKIARPVVETMSRTAQDARICEAIVALGHSLKLQVVAEGIENPAQLEGVRGIDCDRAQGFYIDRPLEAAAASSLLDRAMPARGQPVFA